MNIFNKKLFFTAILFSGLLALLGCQNAQLAEESAASVSGGEVAAAEALTAAQGAQSTADAAMIRANEAFQQAQTVRRIAERAVINLSIFSFRAACPINPILHILPANGPSPPPISIL